MRFVLLSFAFLAWAFYELSGGADFQPRVAAIPADSKSVVIAASPTIKSQPVKASSLVARPAIAPVKTVEVAQEPTLPVTTPVTNPETEFETAANLNQIRTGLGQGISLFSSSSLDAQPLMLASLEQGAAGLTVAPPLENVPVEPANVPEPVADIREISGTRVNMRDGPGTIYPVITRLTIGHEVEVLGDSGTGWLRLRTLPEKTTGWISASLVSKAKR